MKRLCYLLFLVLTCAGCRSQSIETALERHTKEYVPFVQVEEMPALSQKPLLLDTRSREEYEVSHLPGALWVGYKEFDPDRVQSLIPDKDQSILVYCSIGVRSEKIGVRLQDLGYTQVRNLYGGIFRYKERGHIVIDTTGKPTENVHAYNRHWGRLLKNARKVY